MKNLLFCMPVRLCNKRFCKLKRLRRDVLFEFHLKIWNNTVYCKVDRLLTGLTAQPKGTTT